MWTTEVEAEMLEWDEFILFDAMGSSEGTMGNQIALRTLGARGSMVVVGRHQHVVVAEAGAAGVNTAFQLHVLDDDGGTVDPTAVRWLSAAA